MPDIIHFINFLTFEENSDPNEVNLYPRFFV